MDNEIWRDVCGYEGKYAVSNMGNVKSLNYNHTRKEKILSTIKVGKDYLYVHLCKEGEGKMYPVHRLVLSTFNPCTDMENLEVNHVNEDKTNNRLENLEWCDRSHNINHGTRNDRVAAKNSIPIAQLTTDGKFVKAWKSSIEAKREGGFYQCYIIQCCKNKYMREGNNIYKGFRWMYLSEFLDKNCGIID